MMKKMIFLTLLLCVSSLALALPTEFTHNNVTWKVEGDKLFGYGDATGDYTGFLDSALIIPDVSVTGNGYAGVAGNAGNAASLQNFGPVYQAAASDIVTPDNPAQQVAGAAWFAFDIIGQGEINIYHGPGVVAGTIATIPEPMTLGLLSLGGLFLRRRK